MKQTIQPQKLKGKIHAPASKSSMQRACAAALLTPGTSLIYNPGHSNDDKAAMDIIQKLGATIQASPERLVIISEGVNPKAGEINCGESGLSIRMFTPIAALSSAPIIISGSGSLVNRPMNFFDEILPELGVKVETNQGKLPLKLQGPLIPKTITIDGSLSSQFLTGLLMAFSVAIRDEEVTIHVNELKSKPYIDLTLDVMKEFGMYIPENQDYKSFVFQKTITPIKSTEQSYTVEGDWSGGAFLLVAGAIAGPIKVDGLSMASTQADKAIVDALIAANAGIAIDQKTIQLHPSPLNAFKFDATDCPDLFPPLVALASYCRGVSEIKGVSRLAHKESNRGLTLQEVFGKMGIEIELDEDTMKIHGGVVKGAEVSSHHDHRIAMAGAVAALQADGTTIIDGAEAVNKSYPDFFKDLNQLGSGITQFTGLWDPHTEK